MINLSNKEEEYLDLDDLDIKIMDDFGKKCKKGVIKTMETKETKRKVMICPATLEELKEKEL